MATSRVAIAARRSRVRPVVDDGTRGRVEILWTRGASRGRSSGGAYEIDGNTIRVHDPLGHDVSITFEWGHALRVRFGDVDEQLVRAPSVCNAARDCVMQEHTVPEVECAQRVQWSCDRGEHRCLAHCGSPDRAPAQQSCGRVWCPPHQVCCNSAAGVCTAPGEGCGQ